MDHPQGHLFDRLGWSDSFFVTDRDWKPEDEYFGGEWHFEQHCGVPSCPNRSFPMSVSALSVQEIGSAFEKFFATLRAKD